MLLEEKKNLGMKLGFGICGVWGCEWDFGEIRVRRRRCEGLGRKRESMVVKVNHSSQRVRERQSLGRFGPFGFGRVLEMERRVRDSAIVEIGPLNQMDLGCLGPFGRKETQWSNKIMYIFKIKFANPSVYTIQ